MATSDDEAFAGIRSLPSPLLSPFAFLERLRHCSSHLRLIPNAVLQKHWNEGGRAVEEERKG